MKLLWWKIYLGLNIAFLIFVTIAEFSYPSAPPGLFIADVVIYILSLIGIYAFIFKKPIFTHEFWKYFFWFSVVYSLVFLLYAIAPDAPIINYISNISYGEKENLLLSSVISILVSIPYMFAMYSLSKGHFLQLKTKAQEAKEVGKIKWGMVQTSLWGYSFVFVAILLLLSFVPAKSSSGGEGEFDFIYSALIFAPIWLFWLWVTFEYKRYKWNWWRITLLLNSLLFSGIIVFGTFLFEPSTSVSKTEDFDIIGLLQVAIIFVGLYVFGYEQFAKQKAIEPREELKQK